jgi:hypothetical protein
MTAAAVPARARFAEARQRLMIRVAVAAGTAVRVVRGPARSLPGLGGAAGFSVGVGEIAGHVFGHGLAPWVGLAVGSVFALWLGAELNRAPRVPRRAAPVEDDL